VGELESSLATTSGEELDALRARLADLIRDELTALV
jgi:hypothetical protein